MVSTQDKSGSDPVISVRDLCKSFGANLVVDSINMTINRGEVFGFLGANGSGKTTTIRMLCGLLRPDSGVGRCLGYDIVTEADLIKQKIGYMPQHFSYYRDLTVRENLEFVAQLRGQSSQGRILPIMQDFGLHNKQDQLAGALSGGWKQRLSLAAALLHKPELLFLDEPTAGVDPESRRYFWDVIHDLASQKVTILVTTHYMDEAERCNRLAFITFGKLEAVGTQFDIVQGSGLYAFSVQSKDYYQLAKKIEAEVPEVMVVIFGNDFHVVTKSTHLDTAVCAILDAAPQKVTIKPVPTTVEHIFIQLVKQYDDRS